MRRKVFLIVLAAVQAACGPQPTGEQEAEKPAKPRFEGWKDIAGGKMNPDGSFYSETGRFIAVFPGEPVHESRDIDAEVGKLRMEAYVYQESVTMAYMVAYTDYPTKYVADIGWKDFLDRAAAGALKSLSIEKTDEQEYVEVNGFHGVKYRAHGDGPHIVSQTLLVGSRMFQVTLLSDGVYPADAVCDQFINGFHMILPGQKVEEDLWPEGFKGDTARKS